MASTATWRDAVVALNEDDEVDILIVSPVPLTPAFHSLPESADHDENFESDEQLVSCLRRLAAQSVKPIAFVVDCGSRFDPFADGLRRDGAPVFRSVDRAMSAITTLVSSQ